MRQKTTGTYLKEAEAIFQTLPPVLVEALRVAQTLLSGGHGRKRPGIGSQFYEYRPYTQGESTANIDWRASGRSEHIYTRKLEHETAQKAFLWVENSLLSQWHSLKTLPLKKDRATVLTLAFAAMLLENQEVVGAIGATHLKTYNGGLKALPQLLEDLEKAPPLTNTPFPKHACVVLAGAFTLNPGPIFEWLEAHKQQNITPILLDVIDPAEATFPYKGATLFKSFLGLPAFKTGAANTLKQDYLQKWQKNQAELSQAVRTAGGTYIYHNTSTQPYQTVLDMLRAFKGAVL